MAAVDSGLIRIDCLSPDDAVLAAHLVQKLVDEVCIELSEIQMGSRALLIIDSCLESCDLAGRLGSCTRSLSELSFSR